MEDQHNISDSDAPPGGSRRTLQSQARCHSSYILAGLGPDSQAIIRDAVD